MSGLLGEKLGSYSQSEIDKGVPGHFNQAGAMPFLRYCTNYTEMLGCSTVKLEDDVSQAFVSVLEYLCAEILDLSGNAARVSGTDINARALELAIIDDEELTALFRDFGMVIAGGGVLPNIQRQQQQY